MVKHYERRVSAVWSGHGSSRRHLVAERNSNGNSLVLVPLGWTDHLTQCVRQSLGSIRRLVRSEKGNRAIA